MINQYAEMLIKSIDLSQHDLKALEERLALQREAAEMLTHMIRDQFAQMAEYLQMIRQEGDPSQLH